MYRVRRGVSAVSAYATIRKEMSFQAVCFRLKLKKLTIGRLKDLCPFIPVEDVEELDYPSHHFESSRQIFYNLSNLNISTDEEG